ncbi:glycosyltransferase family 4 protein [Verrucomicrobiota bacterium sgz303538]
MRGITFALAASDFSLAERSERSLLANGITPERSLFDEASLRQELASTDTPLLLLQCGSWLVKQLPAAIPSSGTGLPLLAYGKTKDDPAWTEFLSGGGEFPVPRCLYVEVATAKRLSELLRNHTWAEALALLLNDPEFRSVQLPELTHAYDPALRVLQVVTTIQIGGAERVTLDLAEGLNKRGQRVWVAALSRPPRKAYPAPKGFIDLSVVNKAPDARAQAIARIARELHIDLIHGHLISGAESEALCATGIPVVITMHNMPQSWPRGFETPAGKADMLIACSQVVAKAIAAAHPGTVCRTAWNGIAIGRYAPTPQAMEEAARWRESRGWDRSDFVIISVANPRKQKRLDRIPEIISRLQQMCPNRKVRCILAGETAPTSADGVAAQAALEEAIARWSMHEHILQVGGSDEIRKLLCASDAYLSTSGFEGLSLAQLEALASGLPIVTTDVGGASEIARELRNDIAFYRRLPVDAAAEKFVSALLSLPSAERTSRLPAAFHRERMAWRVEQLYHVALGMRQRTKQKADGLWLITNNFSMGGAQSSARRLLEKLKSRGINVRAFTVQEDQPTRGSLALERNGIPVTHISPAHLKAPAAGAAEILAAAAAANPPEAVLFWNLITSYKMLLADGLEGVSTFDVSPGEMYFRSLEEYFRNPRPELPYRNSREYGANLAGMVVKFERERPIAEEQFGRPVSVIRNGVDLQFRQSRPATGKLVFGTAARISPDKRLDDLIKAFTIAAPSLPPYELHIAGKIERGADLYAKQLQEQGAALPIVWRGELPSSAPFLEELDIFVMISEPAGCPNASLEAMAVGLPVIATDVGGASEQVIDRHTGRLTPRRDNTALAAAIIEVARNPEVRTRYGRAAQAHTAAKFSLDLMADSYTSLCLRRCKNSQQAAA